MFFQNVSTDVSPGRKLASRFPFTKAVLAVLPTALIAPAMFDGNEAQAQLACMAADPPTCSLQSWAPLTYPQNLQVFNLYLDDQWDQRPDHANLQISAIDDAVRSLIASQYFDAAHQYGVPNISFAGSTNTNRPFMACPHRLLGNNLPGIMQQITCEESQPTSGLPTQVAVPTPNCQLCAVVPNGCLFDPLSLCLATPNATGNTIYNIFIPHDTILDDFGRRSCAPGSYTAYHMQVPSLPLLGILGTQGRPLYITVIPTACASNVQQLMAAVSHELIEAVTNPLPLSHWIEQSFSPPLSTLLTDPTHLEFLATQSEPADICSPRLAPIYPGTPQEVNAARYWSNADGTCMPRVAQGRITTDVAPGVASTPDGVLFLGKAPDGRIFSNRRVLGQPAQGWLELGGLTNDTPAAATARGTPYLYLAVKGLDGYVWMNQGNIGGPYVGWQRTDFQTDVAPAVASTPDGVLVFAKDLQGRVFSNRFIVGQAGQGWREVEGGGLTNAAPAAAVVGIIPYVFVAVRGLDGYVWINQGNLGSPYVGWQRTTTDMQTDVAPAVASAPDGVVLYAKDLQGRVFSNRFVLGPGEQGWREMEGGGRTNASPAAATVGSAPYHFVAVRGLDGNVWTNQGMPGGPYVGWQ